VKSKKSLFFVVSITVICGLAVLLLVLQTGKDEEVAGVEATVPPERQKDATTGTPEEPSPAAGVQEKKRRKPRLPKNAIDKKKRAEMLALILSALQEKEAKKKKKHSRESMKPAGLPAKYIREAVNEIVPLLKECYEMELEDRGRVSGKVVLGFDLIADDEYGGLVEEARIQESDLSKELSDSFAECLRESVYALRLNAPEWGGRTTVRYPLIFNAIGF
jgi:hypothetical protein